MKVLVETTQTFPQFSRLNMIKDLKGKLLYSEDFLGKVVRIDGEGSRILFKMIDMFDNIKNVDFVLIVCGKIVNF